MSVEASIALVVLAQAILDKKGFNILALDARGSSSFTDYLMIAEGRSDRHLRAICDSLLQELHTQGWKPLAVEGKKEGEWIAIDYGQIVVHLFAPGWRERYSLEELWREFQIVDIPLVVREDLQKRQGSWENYE